MVENLRMGEEGRGGWADLRVGLRVVEVSEWLRAIVPHQPARACFLGSKFSKLDTGMHVWDLNLWCRVSVPEFRVQIFRFRVWEKGGNGRGLTRAQNCLGESQLPDKARPDWG